MAQVQPKSNLTNPEYQAKFLPIISRAETLIKDTITKAVVTLTPLFLVRADIRKIIQKADEKIPADVIDRQQYIIGLQQSAERLIDKYYRSLVGLFALFGAAMVAAEVATKKQIDTPKKMYQQINRMSDKQKAKTNTEIKKLIDESKKTKWSIRTDRTVKAVETPKTSQINNAATPTTREYNMWAEKKGYPHIEDYDRLLNKQLQGVARFEFAPQSDPSKRRISNWQKAELDIRHESQMKMVDDMRENGVQLAYISSHPDCSKRCEKWQGKLMNLTEHAELSGFRMKDKVDGQTVYSLTDIMAQKDKYGYENNIINGFNCRHHLIPYKPGMLPPKKYSDKDIKKERKINTRLRAMEREIRKVKMEAQVFKEVDSKKYKMLMDKAKKMTNKYIEYAQKNGFAYYPERIKI